MAQCPDPPGQRENFQFAKHITGGSLLHVHTHDALWMWISKVYGTKLPQPQGSF